MYNSNINLNLYKTFYEVAKYGSISGAAKQTYSSQPAISKAIKKLEEELNVKLFYRNLNGVELTDKGKELFFMVEQSYNNLVVAERNMIETENLQRGKLSVGMPSNIGSFFLFDKIIDFHNKYKNIEITIITGSTQKLLNLLDSHSVDFVIDTSPINTNSDDIIITKLKEVNYCFAVNKNTNIKDVDKIKSIKDLKSKQLILPIPGTSNRNDLEEIIKLNNIKLENVLNIHTSEMIISAIKKDLGIGYIIHDLIKEEEKKGELQVVELKEKLPSVMINLIYNKKYLTTAPKKFILDYIDNNIKL